MPARVGVYCRISEDIAGGWLGVKRQEADARSLAGLRRWQVGEVFVDNDLSAYKPKVVRPEFERLLESLAAGVLDGVVVYDLDRFARKPADLERAINIFDQRDGLVFATVQGDIDLSSADGRTMARIMVAFANKSSMDTARRVKRKHLELARTGVPVGGNRPFGWLPDRRTLDPTEAALLRQAAQDVLAGVGLHTICRRWNEQGVRTTVGNLWQHTVLRQTLLSPRLAGYRVYQKDIARHEDGSPVIGLFEAVLEEPVWRAVRDTLLNPARLRGSGHDGRRKYLLAGLVRCGACSSLMHGMANNKWNTFTYTCRPPTSGGCGKCTITGGRTDDLITELVIRYLADRRVKPLRGSWTGEANLDRSMGRIKELMDAYTSGAMGKDTVFPAVAQLEAEVKTLNTERAEFLKRQVTSRREPVDVASEWPTMDMDKKRAVVASVLQAVVIKPSERKGGRYNPDRVEPVWR
jgi:site-specific DNA recombinase